MSKKDSFLRQRKRQAMRRNATRFTDRVQMAIRTNTPIRPISFRIQKPAVDLNDKEK